MSATAEKFVCPACYDRCKGQISWGIMKYNGFTRYRKCEKCGITFVTLETIRGISRKSRKEAGNGRD